MIEQEERVREDMPEPDRQAKWTGITPRSWVIGLLLIPLLMFWLEYTEIVAKGADLAAMSLPMAVLFALLVIIPINLLIKRLRPRAALTQAELLTIYVMNTVSLGIGGIGMMQFLNPALVGWSQYATPENRWQNLFFRFLPHWALPDSSVIPDYYAGKSSFFRPEIYTGWAGAIAVWTAFIFFLLFSMYCIAALMRRQWVQNEKLIFPIVIIPLEITRDGGDTPLWRNKALWLGIVVPVVLESMASIHNTLIPTFPRFLIKPDPSLDLGANVTASPWKGIGYTVLSFYPLVIGLTYLLSLDVSFSCWFFYLFTKVENVAATAFGFRDPGAPPALANIPYIGEQGVGAFLGLALFSLWLARPHLAATFRKAFRRDDSVDDSDEPLSYRAAYVGLFACGALLVGFGVTLGLSLPASLLFFGLYLLFALAMTRIRAEAGLPWGPGSQAGWPGAHTVLTGYGGTQNFSGQELTSLAFLHWFDRDFRCLMQPHQLEAMKMASSAEPRPLNPRHLTAAILVATVVGTLAAWICCLGIYYHYGASSARLDTWRTGQGSYPFSALQNWLNNPKPLDESRIGGAVAGMAITGLLGFLRTRFVWWPLHPIGYAAGNTDIMVWAWFPTLLGWLCKVVILRYGGVKIYRQALPFFIGLVLGDYVISGLWALFFLATGLPGYRTFPI